MKKETIVYAVCDPTTNEIRYVGKTCQTMKARMAGHRKCKEQNHRANWFRKLYSDGYTPEYHTLEVVPVGEDWVEAEVFWILYFKSLGARLLNCTVGGEGAPGVRWSEESKAKQRINAARNIEVNRENIKKAQESNIGRKQSTEWLEKRRVKMVGNKVNVGRKHSKEWVEKAHAPLRGRKRAEHEVLALIEGGKKKFPFTEEELTSILEMYFFYGYPINYLAKKFNVSHGTMKKLFNDPDGKYAWVVHPLRCPALRGMHQPSTDIPKYKKRPSKGPNRGGQHG